MGPIDDNFWLVFQILFELNFMDLGGDAQEACRKRLDSKNDGKVTALKWRLFYATWTRSGSTMADYIQGLSRTP